MGVEFKKQISKWVLIKLIENPNKFGKDGANSEFMRAYLLEVCGVDLSLGTLKAISTVSRVKSDVLLEHPEYDKREKDAPKKKKSLLNSEENINA